MRITPQFVAILSSGGSLPTWGVVAFWISIAYLFVSSARAEERKRREEGQQHTAKDVVAVLDGIHSAGIQDVAFFVDERNRFANTTGFQK